MRLVLFIVLISFVACKNDKPPTSIDTSEVDFSAGQKDPIEEASEISTELYAALDRLRIRSDSSMDARTVVTISERDTLTYLEDFSDSRIAMTLRGKYYYEPWLKVKHSKSSKIGWVYGGAVKYDSKVLQKNIRDQSLVMKEIYADDLEWEGTVPTSWKTATISNAEAFKIFLINFKDMVKHDEVNKIADLIRFPIKNIENRQQFKDNYSRIFSDEMKEIVGTQRLDRIFRNSAGASLGNGDIWFQQVGDKFKIVSVNFKGLDDLKDELMQRLSNGYYAQDPSVKLSIKAFKIRNFLELTLNYQGIGGTPAPQNLGKYSYESSLNGIHNFYQDTQDSVRRRLVFIEEGGITTMKVTGGGEPELSEFIFVGGN